MRRDRCPAASCCSAARLAARRAPQAAGATPHARAHHARQAGAAAGFPEFPLRQPGRAEGRRGGARARSAASTASTASSCAAPRPATIEPGLRHAAERHPPTRPRPPTAIWRRRSSCRPTACGSPSSCGPRRASTTARRSPPRTSPGPSTRCARRAGRTTAQYYADVQDVAVGEPAPGGVPLQVQPEPRAAADPRRDAGAAEALVGGPRLHPAADRAAARLRPLPGRTISSSAARITYARVPDWWATRPADRRGPQQFRHACAPSISATRPWRSRRSRPGRSTSAQENIAKQWATAYDFPARAEGPGEEGGDPPPAADRHAGLRDEHAPAAIQGPRGCARRWPRCSTSSG